MPPEETKLYWIWHDNQWMLGEKVHLSSSMWRLFRVDSSNMAAVAEEAVIVGPQAGIIAAKPRMKPDWAEVRPA
jgi:hypothetical protein